MNLQIAHFFSLFFKWIEKVFSDWMQDSLAQAVAVEMQKNYQKELGPQPVPLLVFGQSIDEEEVSFNPI